MIRLLQLCNRAAFPLLLAGALCGGPISLNASSLSPSGQPLSQASLEQPGDSVGFTYLDLQTQQSMPDRLVYNPATKVVQMVWMADVVTDPLNSMRGSYLAAVDVSGEQPAIIPLPSGWQRIETRRSGWPSIAAFADGSVGVAAHAPLLFSKNLPASYTAFSTYQKDIERIIYTRTAVDGNDNAHLIFTYSSGDNFGQLGYTRSQDRGQTWSEPILLTGPSAPGGATAGIAGYDTYAMTARGETIVVVYVDREQRLWKRVSTTAGQDWQSPVLLHQPQRTFHITERLEGDSVRFVTDTVPTVGSQMDVVLGHDGRAHVVVSLLATFLQGQGVEQSGAVTRIGMDTLHVDRSYFRTWGLGYIEEGVDGLVRMGPPAGEQWDGTGRFIANSGNGSGAGYSCYPQLGVDESGAVYCVYTSVKNGDLQQITADEGNGPATVDALFGHIYATHRLPGRTWSKPVDLTPAGMDCLYGTLANTVDGTLYIGYQSDAVPGIRSVHKTTPVEQAAVRFRALPVSALNESLPVSVQSPYAGEGAESALEIFPNPATDRSHVVVELSTASEVSVELYTAAGARVATVFRGMLGQGRHEIPLITEGGTPATGQYYCLVRAQGVTRSGILSIVR